MSGAKGYFDPHLVYLRGIIMIQDIGLVLIGLVGLVLGGDFLVRGASRLASSFGVSTLVIGLTIVAFGTSAPELLVNVSAALRGNNGLALGNVVGSNIFNLLMVLSIPGIISPPDIGPIVFTRDFMFMMAATLILAVAIFVVIKQGKPALGRFTGILLLLVYVMYYLVLGFTPH